MKNFRLKELRIKNKLTQEKLGELVGLTKQAISRLEMNKNKYTDNNLIKKLAVVLNSTPEYILGLRDSSIQENMINNPPIYSSNKSFDSRYGCKCGNLMGRIHSGIICENCNTAVKFIEEEYDDDFLNIVIQCKMKLNKTDINIIKDIMKTFIKNRKGNNKNEIE